MAKSYLNESYLEEAKKDLPSEDARVNGVRDRLYQMAGQATADPNNLSGYSQVDLRPDWYKTFLTKNKVDQNGPPLVSTGGAVADAALQAGAAGAGANAERFARLPGAKAGDIMNMQSKANAAGLLASGLGALINKKSNDFDTQQKRAVADSASLRKNQKTGLSFNDLLGLANYDKTLTRNEQIARRDVEKNAQALTEADPNSPESRSLQVALVKSGVAGPETVADTSKDDLKNTRTAIMQVQGQENKTNEFDYEQSQLEGRKLSEEERAELRRVQGERRDENVRRAQSVIPGHKWANNTPPSPVVQDRAREFVTSQHEIITAADELKNIQQRLAEIGEQAARAGITSPEAVGQYYDKYLGAPETKALLAKAQLLQQKMVTALRTEDHLGVLQQFEKAMEDAVNPTAGTIGAYFRGPAPWDALIEYERDYGRQKKKAYGLYEDGDPEWSAASDPHAQPAEQQVKRFARPVAQRPHGGGSPSRGQVEAPLGQSAPNGYEVQPGDSLGNAPVPPIPADARQPAANPSPVNGPQGDQAMPGMWVVEMPSGPSKPRQLTESQYKILQQKGLQVRKAQ